MLTATGRRWRLAVAAAVVVLLLWGTFWGEDDHFPFGPFRMYANATETTGRVRTMEVWGTTTSGEEIRIPAASLGLRRAELEGQRARFAEDPALVGQLAVAYHRFEPDRPRLVEVRLVHNVRDLVDGRVTGQRRVVFQIWPER